MPDQGRPPAEPARTDVASGPQVGPPADGRDARLRELTARNAELANDVDDLRHETRRLLTAVGQFQGETIALQRALAEAYAAGEDLARIRAELEEQPRRIEAHVAAVLDGFGERLDAGGRRLDGCVARMEEAALRHERAAATVDTVLRSGSWRLTRPLRVLARLWRRSGGRVDH